MALRMDSLKYDSYIIFPIGQQHIFAAGIFSKALQGNTVPRLISSFLSLFYLPEYCYISPIRPTQNKRLKYPNVLYLLSIVPPKHTMKWSATYPASGSRQAPALCQLISHPNIQSLSHSAPGNTTVKKISFVSSKNFLLASH
ncbi:hypothetical protein CLIB1423_04S06018 [[Candida] railenensis]|uniref:Uncharacterized protein n=1 Tax=[Candida] railenensis TaxID=45579 RepID=A0A9P0QM58_9ASCO|nr:hypothetical protein CLIB1423_04S06018 [[Candida] railenensis]